MRDSIIIYRSFLEAMEGLDDSQKVYLFEAICRYGLDGIEPDTEEMARLKVKGLWVLIKPQVDANIKRSESGSKGGRPKKNAFCDYQQRDIDFDELEKKVYKNGNSV